MVSTRSRTAQTHLEDFSVKSNISKPKGKKPESSSKAAPKANTSRKRKPADVKLTDEKPPTKRTKASPKISTKSKDDSAADDEESSPIVINRAPVLQLWAASVAHVTYPGVSWETCLSAGSAVSSICAVAKGRSIGAVPEKDDSEAKQEKREQAKRKQEDLDELEVMHFRLKIKDGLAVVGSDAKGKPGDEDALKKKFRDEQYHKVKAAFDEALRSWKGDEVELNKKAFHMYETFRPDVSQGQKGWGRKGELKLEAVANTVKKGRSSD